MIKRIHIRFQSPDRHDKPLGPDIRHEYRVYVSHSAQFPTLVFVSIFPVSAAPMPDPAHYPLPADTPLKQIGDEVAMKLQALPGNGELSAHPPQFSHVENEELERVIDGFRELLMGMERRNARVQ